MPPGQQNPDPCIPKPALISIHFHPCDFGSGVELFAAEGCGGFVTAILFVGALPFWNHYVHSSGLADRLILRLQMPLPTLTAAPKLLQDTGSVLELQTGWGWVLPSDGSTGGLACRPAYVQVLRHARPRSPSGPRTRLVCPAPLARTARAPQRPQHNHL